MDNYSQYTGKNIKIAVIDDGYNKTDNFKNVIMYDYLGNVVNDSSSKTYHGKQCIEIIKLHSKNATIFSIDATSNDKKNITEYTMIKAIEFAITLGVHIINISQGLDTLSYKLSKVLQNALAENILIFCSKNPSKLITFPADLKGIFRVEMFKDNKNTGITCINETIRIPQQDVFYKLNSDKLFPIGNSFATAYMSSLCARMLEFNPMVTYESVIRRYSSANKKNQNEISTKATNVGIINYDINFDIYKDKKYLKEKYKFFYDHKHNSFRDKTNFTMVKDVNEIECIIHINPLGYELKKYEFDSYEGPEYFIGCFENIEESFGLLEENNNKLNYIDKPAIAVMSYGENMEKFKIQSSLLKSFLKNKVKIANFSFNPQIEQLKSSYYIKYPSLIEYPKFIYNINNKMYKDSQNAEILLLTFPGNIDYYKNNSLHISNLYKPLLTCTSFDIVILSISNFISYQELRNKINELSDIYGAEVYIYISQKSKAFDILDDFEKSEIHLITTQEVENFKSIIKENFPDTKVFDSKDLKQSILFNEIVVKLS